MKLQPPNNKTNFLLISEFLASSSQDQEKSMPMETARLASYIRNGEMWENP